MMGSGRTFNEKGFINKLDEIQGYILCDIESFPDVPFWIIDGEAVRKWYENNELGAATKISRVKALSLLRLLPN
jgi:hypothetical protein